MEKSDVPGSPSSATKKKATQMIGEMVKAHRERAGYSQSELASRLDTHQTAIAHWESGRREPTATNLAAIATALGISMDVLFGRKETTYDKGFRDGYEQCRDDMLSATKLRLGRNAV